MKPILFILVLTSLFLNNNLSFGQAQKVDSLQNLLATANDTTKVNLLRLMGIYSRSVSKDDAVKYGIQSLEKAQEIGFVPGEIKALYILGSTYGMTDDYAPSLTYLNQCVQLALKNGDYDFVMSAYNGLGIVYKRIGDYPKSQEYYLKSLQLNDSMQMNRNISSIYNNLGVLYDLMNEEDKAIENYQKSLEVYNGSDKDQREMEIISNIGLIDLEKGKYSEALKKFKRVQASDAVKKDSYLSAQNYANMGICYMNLDELQNAEAYLKQSLESAQRLSLQQEVAVAYQNLAKLKLKQNRLKEANELSIKNLASLELMGQAAQKQEAHNLAYQIYEAMGQYPKAIKELKLSMAYKDSLLNETKIKEIQSLQIKHEVYIKDKELKENQLQMALLGSDIQANNKRIVYLSLITALLLISAGLLFFGLRNKIKSNRELHEKTVLISEQKELIGQMNQELEKRMLRAQMNPHFIFNSLNSIQYLINTDDKKNALKYLSKFAKLLRQVLESSININLSLKEEIQLLKIYVELESLRFDNSFKYTFTVDKNLDVEEYEVPMLLVQPYIENAIIHGLMPKEGEKKLKIIFNDKDEFIECIIEDNGVGITKKSEGTTIQRPSRGMSITAKRIEMLKRFSDQELVTIENLENGTRVTILIPKHH
ncbi:tetratricopeptide repeat-containing sensor histidine kinase [Flagellimonas beolgyonensis]|uniref:tetratricopeptide repeat-containing sensor histidine kinase n=1 Tax=Flagellimonas beolgyonensis TaxID=864064 RepID=UPI003D653CA1